MLVATDFFTAEVSTLTKSACLCGALGIEDNNDATLWRKGLALLEETMADLRHITTHTGLEAQLPC